jgi:hypothetical protein
MSARWHENKNNVQRSFSLDISGRLKQFGPRSRPVVIELAGGGLAGLVCVRRQSD